MSNTITIPKTLTHGDDLVVMPRREYEQLKELRKIREFTPTATEKRALARGRRNMKAGRYTVWSR